MIQLHVYNVRWGVLEFNVPLTCSKQVEGWVGSKHPETVVVTTERLDSSSESRSTEINKVTILVLEV